MDVRILLILIGVFLCFLSSSLKHSSFGKKIDNSQNKDFNELR